MAVVPSVLLGSLAALLPGAPAEAARALPTLTISDVSVTEGGVGSRDAVFTIVRSGNTAVASSVSWTTADVTATAPSDYAAKSGTVSFAEKQTTQKLSVPVLGETVVEADETFMVKLSAPVNATIVDDTGVGTIVNDDSAFLVDDVSVTEGDAGTKLATFTITRKGLMTSTASVGFSTVDGSATAPADYCAVSGRATFEPGRASVPVAVCVLGDTVVEGDESFWLQLSAPEGAVIEDRTGQGTIQNDDQSISVNDISVTEGNSGSAIATFTVTRSGPSTSEVTVDYATADGSAMAPGDYSAGSGKVVIAPNATSASVSIPIHGDSVVEGDETFVVRLSNSVGAPIVDATGIATIVNDDAAFSINDMSIREGHAGTSDAVFTIARSGALGAEASVQWKTYAGTASAWYDYESRGATATFTAGAPSVEVRVPVRGENYFEGNETFSVVLSAPIGATIADGTGIGTILNDDSKYSISHPSVSEGSSGTKLMTFTVSRSPENRGVAQLQYTTAGITATPGVDFLGASGTVSFAEGQSDASVSVSTYGDITIEGNETFQVRLSSSSNYTIAPSEGIGTIVNDDAPTSFHAHNHAGHYIRHRDYLGELTELPTPGDVMDGTFRVVPGLADSKGISFESVNFPGHYLRHEDLRMKLHQYSGDTLFREDATFYVETGLADASKTSFRSYNYSSFYIRHQNFELFIQEGSDQLFRDDSTFQVVAPPM